MPVGVPGPLAGATIAVNVTVWPDVEGSADEAIRVVVASSG